MNIEPDIFDYLQTTSLEPHDDYTSEITYKDQKIIWTRLQYQDKEIERLNKIRQQVIDELFELKDMIYKPETREINFDVQNKISSIIKILGSDKD